ncbi:MAG: MarP family serine protease [Actinomycetia bacterium]|nr:MarP family serine protease [Actinomycetes bacterium]
MSLKPVDWIAVGLIALTAFSGFRRGLIASALSLGGLVAGAYVGSRAVPHLLHGGAGSRWTPLAGLGGAVAGALLLQTVAGVLGSFLRGGLKLTPFRFFDSLGGLALGAAAGVAFVWVIGASALLVPGQTRLRQEVQSSTIVRRLDEQVPPSRLLGLLARIDPFPSIMGPAAPASPPSAKIARRPAIVRATASVVRITGSACGLGVEGSGWFATPHLVVTAAHVVAGERDTSVQIPRSRGLYSADVIAFDARNDVAVLRVHGASPATPLRIADARPGVPVAIIGYPENGPLTVIPGRIGRTAVVLTRDAYGHGPVPRTITAVAGRVRHGNSGGPAVDATGAVEATIFAQRVGSPSGYGVPASLVRRALDRAKSPVSTGDCAAG